MTWRSVLGVCFVAAAAAACGDDGGSGARACERSADCASGSVCVDGTCRRGMDAGGTDSGSAEDAGARPDAVAIDTGPPCVATESPEVTCNAIDDDCNGFVDDVDVAGDGICDCLRIGVIGDPGTRESSSFQAWLESRGTTVVRFGLDDAPLTEAQLAAHDVIVLDRLRRDYGAEEASALRTFVERGGGLMVMTGYDGSDLDRTRPNSLLAPFGVEYLPELRNGPVTMFEAHPLTNGLTSVTFAGGYRVTSIAGAGGDDTIVARLPDGAAGLAQERGDGRVFVWGDEWIQFDSEWTTMPEITQLWVNAMQWLGPQDRCVLLF